MNHDHLMLVSEQDLTPEGSGLTELFEKFPPNRVLPFYAGSLSEHPDTLRDLITNAGGEMLDPCRLTQLGSERVRSKKDAEALPYTVFSEMQTALIEYLPAHLSKSGSDTPLVILIASGSGFHSSLLFTLGLAIRNAIFVTIDRYKEITPVIASHEWVHEAMTTSPNTHAMRDVLVAMLLQTSRQLSSADLEGWMSAEEITGGGISGMSATGFSNPAEILYNDLLITMKEGSKPIEYRLTGRGWIVALRCLEKRLEDTGPPPHQSAGVQGERLAEQFIPATEDNADGRIMGISAVLHDEKLRACNLRQSMGAVEVGLSLFWRRRDRIHAQLVVDDDEFDIDEDADRFGTFSEAHLRWKMCSERFGDSELSWALSDVEGPQCEECFRQLCQWMWPWVTGYEHIATDGQKRRVNWTMDITQLGMQQSLLANLFGTLWGRIPLTYVTKRGGKGVRGGDVRSTIAKICVTTLPNHRLLRALLATERPEWDRPMKVLVGLETWSQIRASRLEQRWQDSGESDPFSDEEEVDDIPPAKVNITDLETLLFEAGVPDYLRLDSREGNAKTMGDRLRKMQHVALQTYEPALIEADRRNTPRVMSLTQLGEIVARLLLHQHSDEEE